MTNKTFPAKTESLSDVLGFVEETLEGFDCPMKIQTALCVAIEEVFVNVAHYAYPDGEGDMSLHIGFDEQTRVVTFQMTDKGIPFDPLTKPEPDITLSAEGSRNRRTWHLYCQENNGFSQLRLYKRRERFDYDQKDIKEIQPYDH